MATEKKTVVIHVEGGLIQAIHLPRGVKAEIIDMDVEDDTHPSVHASCSRCADTHAHQYQSSSDWDGKARKDEDADLKREDRAHKGDATVHA